MKGPFFMKKGIIVDIKEENENTKRFYISVEDFPEFKPGQFNMIYVYGQGEVPISISSISKDILEHTVRLAGEVTEDLFKLKEGDFVGIRGPFGSHFPVEDFTGYDILLIAGGLGLADIKPVVEYIIANRDKYGKVYLLVGAKNPSGLLYREEYESWEKHIEVYVTVDRAEGDWKGRTGLVTDLIDLVNTEADGTVAMMCGPEVMMYFVTKKLLGLGICESGIFLSMERHMKCAVGTCGHCQFGYSFVCKEGPVFKYSFIKPIFGVKEI